MERWGKRGSEKYNDVVKNGLKMEEKGKKM